MVWSEWRLFEVFMVSLAAPRGFMVSLVALRGFSVANRLKLQNVSKCQDFVIFWISLRRGFSSMNRDFRGVAPRGFWGSVEGFVRGN